MTSLGPSDSFQQWHKRLRYTTTSYFHDLSQTLRSNGVRYPFTAHFLTVVYLSFLMCFVLHLSWGKADTHLRRAKKLMANLEFHSIVYCLSGEWKICVFGLFSFPSMPGAFIGAFYYLSIFGSPSCSLHLQMSNFEFGSFFSSTDLHVHWLFLGNWVISIYIHSVRLDVQFML